MINEHPGVSHNYKRNNAYNLWFTIAVPPNSRLGLEKTVELLGEMAEAEQVRLMPTLKLFKIGVQLDMTGKEDTSKAKAKPAYGYEERKKAAQTVSDFDIAVIRELQKDLAIEPPVPSMPWPKILGFPPRSCCGRDGICWSGGRCVALRRCFTTARRVPLQRNGGVGGSGGKG